VLALVARPREVALDPPGAQREAGPDLAALEDVTRAGLAFVELDLERDTLLVGEPFTLRVRFGLEDEFERTHLVQLFQRELDVPVQLFAPWLEELEGATALAWPEPAEGVRVALGERVVRAVPLPASARAGRTYRVFELARTFVPTRTGERDLAAPTLRFAQATRFQDDLVQGHVPLDRRDVFVRGAGARVVVRPLPEEGRPSDFSGAIGRFALRAGAEPRELEPGAELALTLVIEAVGELGDLSDVVAPKLDDLAGFHVRGSLVEREPRRMTVRYDLVPDGPEVRALPPVRFAYFDTTPPAGYRVLESEPIAIIVREGKAPAARAPPPSSAAPEPPTLVAWLPLPVFALLMLAWIVIRRARRARPS